MLSTAVSLTLALALLAGLLWWLRRMAAAGLGRQRHIHVIETVHLGPGKCLHLVELAGRGLLVAATAQRCELLCELENLPAGMLEPQTPRTAAPFARLARRG